MRKIAILGLLSSIALSGITPVAAQLKDERTKQLDTRGAAFDSIRAITDGEGVLVRWQPRSESGIAGYNVYRIDGDSRLKANPNIIAGTSPRAEDATVDGQLHQFFDPDGRVRSEYVVEVIRFDGMRPTSAPVATREVKSLEAEVGMSTEAFQAAALSDSSNIQSRRSDLSRELSDIVASYTPERDPVAQFAVASKAGAKIAVKKDGFYRIGASELERANFALTSDPAKWRLFTDGIEQAIIVAPQGEYIEFFGRGVDLPETATRYYYLVADTVPGKRIATKLLRTVPGSPAAKNFPVVVETKERSEYFDTLFNAEEENFLGKIFDGGGRRIRFNLSGVDFSAPTAKVTITLFGWGINVHHRVSSTLNGFDLPVMTQYGAVHYTETFTIPTDYLVEGENVLELFSGAVDTNVFNKVEVSYKRNYQSEAGRLSFSTPGFRKIDLKGFATPDVRVFDTTFEGSPVLLQNLPIEEASEGYDVRLPGTRMMVGYAVEDTALMQSPSVTANSPSTWSSETNKADMLIISHSSPGFLNAAGNWAAYRRSAEGGNFDTKVVSIEDVYDEFNYGLAGAEGIKKFLKYAGENWTTAPKYVLLLGDANEDPRHYISQTVGDNLVPTISATLALNEASSDEALGDFDGDERADVAIGRIPARTVTQLTTAYFKTMSFERNQVNFNRGVLFVHDGAPDVDSAGNTQRLIQQLSPATAAETLNGNAPNASSTLISKFNQGKFLVNYLGHGSSGVWATSSLFSQSSVDLLTNRDNPSFVPQFTCLTGRFSLNLSDSISETLLFSDAGGAAALWASTGKTTAAEQMVMGEKFYAELAGTNLNRLGDLIKSAKSVGESGRDVKLTAVLLGDPALRMP